MVDLEIPQGKRTKFYRFFEILPAFLSYGAIILLIVLSIFSPFWASVYLLFIVVSLFVKSLAIAYRMVGGYLSMKSAVKVDWKDRLNQLENPEDSYTKAIEKDENNEYNFNQHLENLHNIINNRSDYPKPSEIYNAVIIAVYNEPYEVIQPTVKSLLNTDYNNDQMIIFLAYEERGGKTIEETAIRLRKEFKSSFKDFQIVKHPKNIEGEVIGKGGNITYAGKFLKQYCDERGLEYKNVLVTTLDSDNKPHEKYFSCATYEYIAHENRKKLSYQPISLFMNNIWDVPAPMRVIATGNSFWNIISSMRPHLLRNFASHSQSLDALVEMNFWSTRTIVEDGHHFWRSYFHFGGDYEVLSIRTPIYQDAVLNDNFWKTIKAQFIQLRRWSYGASDVPYVAERVLTKKRNVPFVDGFIKLLRLIDSHTTLVFQAPLVAFGGWIPLLFNPASSRSLVAHQLPNSISGLQNIAMIGMFISIFLSLKMLPPKPERYKKSRTIFMILQWLLMPITSICFSSASAFVSQTRLATGKYMDKFDVTEKKTIESVQRARRLKK